jgi:hypothetical protein
MYCIHCGKIITPLFHLSCKIIKLTTVKEVVLVCWDEKNKKQKKNTYILKIR